MGSRYINASDVSKLLGREYSFYWGTINEVHKILKNERKDNEVQEKLKVMSSDDIQKTADVLECVPNVDKILKVLETKKRKITNCEFDEYTQKTSELLTKLPEELSKSVLSDFCMDYGNKQEALILEQRNIKKDNKLRYLNFKIGTQWYKIGCRFDGPSVEIKTRKSKFLGVPDYEKVQVHIYMAINNSDSWTLIEKYGNEEREHKIIFDPLFFEKVKNDLHNKWEYYLTTII
jgi:hypothetical protein